MDKTNEEQTSLATQEIGFDPEVKSYRLVIRAPNVPERKGGLFRTEEYRNELQRTFNVGKVIKIGPLAFVGETQQHYKVDEGDWVWYSKYEREVISGPKDALCYFINDDRILGRVRPEDLDTILNGAT
jgi:co-chaperonin GroES (HSP10)